MKYWLVIQPVIQNQGQDIRIPIGARFDGKTLEQMLLKFKQGPITEWLDQELFSNIQGTLNANSLLSAGDVITFKKPAWVEPEVTDKIGIIFEDEHLIVLDKPAGIPVTPSGDFFQNSLVYLLQRHPNLADVSPIHRLDLETSGVLAFTKNRSHRSFFQRQFTESRVEKTYIALTFGHLGEGNHEMQDYLVKTVKGPIFSKWISGTRKGRLSRTQILKVQHHQVCDHYLSSIILKPLSGRTNQLRAQLAARGHSIIGDKKYFPDEKIYLDWIQHRDWQPYASKLLLPTLALHAKKLSLNLPNSPKTVSFESENDMVTEWISTISKIHCDITNV